MPNELLVLKNRWNNLKSCKRFQSSQNEVPKITWSSSSSDEEDQENISKSKISRVRKRLNFENKKCNYFEKRKFNLGNKNTSYTFNEAQKLKDKTLINNNAEEYKNETEPPKTSCKVYNLNTSPVLKSSNKVRKAIQNKIITSNMKRKTYEDINKSPILSRNIKPRKINKQNENLDLSNFITKKDESPVLRSKHSQKIQQYIKNSNRSYSEIITNINKQNLNLSNCITKKDESPVLKSKRSQMQRYIKNLNKSYSGIIANTNISIDENFADRLFELDINVQNKTIFENVNNITLNETKKIIQIESDSDSDYEIIYNGKTQNSIGTISNLESTQSDKIDTIVNYDSTQNSNTNNECNYTKAEILKHDNNLRKQHRWKPKKGTIQYRLYDLLKEQKSNTAFWNHERYLQRTSDYVPCITYDENLVLTFQVIEDFVEYNRTIFKCCLVKENENSSESEIYYLFINSEIVKPNFSNNSLVRIYPPYILKEVANDPVLKIILNVSKICAIS